ncbi:MAG: hypothetical protein GWP05_06790 [Anaerolineaceae bacterium]|nr:hypothetical protein [Anaerolineaceae bacterium]
MEMVKIGDVSFSRFILGGNPFSGFSHQTPDIDLKMRRFFTTARIKETFHEAERLGVNTVIARADQHIMRVLMEYWDEGGKLQWLAQTCPELGATSNASRNAISGGAAGCHIHGGVTDHLLAEGRLGEVQADIDELRQGGLLAGMAGHNPAVFEWADQHLDVDYYMCCHYNPTVRDKNPEHVHGADEKFREEDRRRMLAVIAGLSRPVIHYKVLAAGRNDPAEAFAVTARAMRDNDVACVGIYGQEMPDQLARDVELFNQSLEAERAAK